MYYYVRRVGDDLVLCGVERCD